MSKTIVSIISAQPVPNYLFIKECYEQGDDLLFITSTKMESNIDPIVHTLGLRNTKIHRAMLPAGAEEQWSDMCEAIKGLIQPDVRYAVNLTGGTKYMALAVQKVFEPYQSEFYYIPFPRNVILTEQRETPIKTRMTVKEFMSVHGHEIKSESLLKQENDSRSMLKLFTKKLRSHDYKIIDQFREFRNTKKPLSLEKIMDSVEGASYEDIADFLGMCGYQYGAKLSKYDFRYLTGGWFEEHVYYLMQNTICPDDILLGVKMIKTNNDLDVVFTKGNILFVVECKTGIDRQGMLNEICYKCAALKGYLKGISAKSYVFALATGDPKWKVIPDSMDVKYFGRDYFVNAEKTKELIEEIKKVLS
ncbi:MAG: DUF1887 family protein [Bacteroidaceae bacterium]|nr:DUF1887 family protein [Bacteroidaceae bacterium]